MSDPTFAPPTVSAALARRLLDTAVAASEAHGQAGAVAVVDNSGVLKGFVRMDGAALLTVQIAQDKAYTAASFGLATHEWHDFIKDDAPLADGIVHTSRLVVFGGGYPIRVDGAVVGGIGVSGGHYTDDMKIATAALSDAGYPAA
ncbi:MAG: heme-binding protein [Pseudonocardia sp.]|uniref:GlcG/HbpS family heme-binding protein n=1 Tax=unclassified Pseudonocardia TaxID=2619320 RepID=UPI00086F778E|nr:MULTISPECIES: heme-binding protein [unclassified Pseudonocardia]MBN9111643.1 heme-binding protein [Pseudonocardia sp.]ODU26504.1 MAG: cobalamin adenosyltransferase [Pseudonocardia sp. SCN 72-51]ODU98218.1 MAG: cobalamin adenosyltransferase [Pseudonocardia sp. SCN 73-27]